MKTIILPLEFRTTFDAKGFALGIGCMLLLVLLILLYSLPSKMAKKRGRSGIGWFFFSLIFSPILAMFIIAILGETEEKRHERIRDEEKIRAMYRS